jgi:hypothetical protein
MGAVTTCHLDLGSEFRPSVDANFEYQEHFEELLARQAKMFQEEIDEFCGKIDSLELALLEEQQRNDQLAEQLEQQEA